MRKLLSMVLCVAMLLGIVSMIPVEKVMAASYERGGSSRDDAIEWDTGETLYGGIEATYETNYWSFTTGENTAWAYFKGVNIHGGVKFKILDENKDEICSFGTNSEDYGNYALLDPETVYYLAASSHIYTENKFELSVTITKDDFPHNMEDASEVVSGKKYTAYLESPWDDDYFYFIAGATTSSINIIGSETLVLFTVYDEDGVKLKTLNSYTDITSVGKGEKATVSYATNIGEKYYVLAETRTTSGFSFAYFGKYMFTIDSMRVVPLQINATDVTMKKGMSFNVTGLLTNSTGGFSFSSSKSTVASIDNTGVITAKKAGKTTITVKSSNGKKVKLAVSVK